MTYLKNKLNDLIDVSIDVPQENESLIYNGSSWTKTPFSYYSNLLNSVNITTLASSVNITEDHFDRQVMFEIMGPRSSTLIFSLPEISNLHPGQSVKFYSTDSRSEFPFRLSTNVNDDYRYVYTNRGEYGTNTFDFKTNGSFIELFVRENSVNAPNTSVKYWFLNTNITSSIEEHTAKLQLIAQSPNSANTPNVEINMVTADTNRWKISYDGHMIPASNSSYDIGEAENKVRHLYLSNNSIKFDGGDVGIDIDGDITFAKSGESADKLATQAYVTANAGGGGGGYTYSAITADPANAQTGYHYSCIGTFTITLPTSGVSSGEEIRIKNMGDGTITIDPQTQTIDGSTTDYVLDVQYSAITLVSTGTNWEII